jgi:hypothetical protein
MNAILDQLFAEVDYDRQLQPGKSKIGKRLCFKDVVVLQYTLAFNDYFVFHDDVKAQWVSQDNVLIPYLHVGLRVDVQPALLEFVFQRVLVNALQ